MPLAISKYEPAAIAFLGDYPIPSVVTPDAMLNWAESHGDGLAPDLLISDPNKRLGSLRRHLNDGGASRNLPEASRFRIIVDDVKLKTMIVKRLHEHVGSEAEVAFDKAVIGAMSPIRRSERAIHDIKSEELSPDEQKRLEQLLSNITSRAVPLRKLLSDQVVEFHVQNLINQGFTETAARLTLEVMPTFGRVQKMLKAVS